MDLDTFATRFRQAAATARDFARRFVEEELPDRMVFRVRLNASYDGNPLHEHERVYPEDSGVERMNSLSECEEERVLSTLWRDGAVPEWVNLSVKGRTDGATFIEVLSCGRFTADERLLYHEREGLPPFHVLGPSLPVGYQDGQRFSIYYRAECWTRAELERLLGHREKVWSLELWGDSFDDRSVADLPPLPALEILELHNTAIDGSGLSGLDRHRRLRVLRLHLSTRRHLNMGFLPLLSSLEVLAIHNLSAEPWGFDQLTSRVPHLSWLTLQGQEHVSAQGSCPSSLDWLEITGRTLSLETILPRRLEHLILHLSAARTEDVEQLLAQVRQLDTLSLRGTPIDEATVRRLLSRFKLKHLDIVDTDVGKDAVRRIAQEHPGLRLLPNPGAVKSSDDS